MSPTATGNRDEIQTPVDTHLKWGSTTIKATTRVFYTKAATGGEYSPPSLIKTTEAYIRYAQVITN